jgi:uncharacterized membrane protein
MRNLEKVFVTLFAIALIQVFIYYPQLPDRMASHFNGSGHANGWSSKVGFFGLCGGLMLLMAMIFLFMPRVSFSDRQVSLPNKDYWMSEERRDRTIRFIRDQMLWFGVAHIAFMICTVQLVIEANLRSTPELASEFLWFLAAFLAFALMWTVRFIGRFIKRQG